MASEIEKKLYKLTGIADLVSDFRKNVFNKLADNSESFNKAEYIESKSRLLAIIESVDDLKHDAEKSPDNKEVLEKILTITKQITAACRQMMNDLPKDLNETPSTTEIADNRQNQEGKKTELEASEPTIKDHALKGKSREDKDSDMDQNECRVYDQQLQDLLEQIEEERQTINGYRKLASLKEDLDQKKLYLIKVKDHEKIQLEYFEKYDKLRKQYAQRKGRVMYTSEITNLENKIDLLRTDLRTAIKTILQRFDDSDKKIISSFSDIIDESNAATIDAILAAFDDGKLENKIINSLANYIKVDLAENNRTKTKNPLLAKRVFELSEQLQNEKAEIEVKHLLKLCIPILPGLIKYEISLGLKGTKHLETAWSYLVKKFGPKKGV